jgi:hypothetical protein
MNVWGATPFLVMAFLNGSASTSLPFSGPSASTGLQALSATAPASASLATPTAVLTQDKSGRFWTATVLLDAADPSCPGQRADYWLETTSPAAIPAISVREVNGSGPRGIVAASPCKVAVIFPRISPIPADATLVLDEAGTLSSTQLTLSRYVGESDYFTIPLITGAVMALLLLGMVFWLVRLRDYEGNRINFWDLRRYWTYETSPSGSLKVGIISVVTILAAFLAAVGVAGSIFPGVNLGPFAVAGLLAGLLSAISTAVSGVLYANWRHWNPDITPGASLRPLLRARLSADSAELHKGSELTIPGAKSKKLRAATAVSLPDATEVMLTDDGVAVVGAGTEAILASDMWTTLEANTRYKTLVAGNPAEIIQERPAPALLKAGTEVELVAPTKVRMLIAGVAELPNAPTAKLKNAAEASLPDAPSVTLPAESRTRLPVNATVTFSPAARLSLGKRSAEFPKAASADLVAAIRDAVAGTTVTVAAGDTATLGENVTAEVDTVSYGSEERVPTLTVPSGAEIRVADGVTVDMYGADRKPDGEQPIQVPARCTVQVPPDSDIKILSARAVELPGGSDILIRGQSVFKIEKDDTVLTISGVDGAPGLQEHDFVGNSAGQSDLTLRLPVRVITHSDAKITVTGAANVFIPREMRISKSTQRKDVSLRSDRSIQLPQSSTALIAPLHLVIVPTLVTILGIGAEIGLVGVLAIRLSDASPFGRAIAWIALVAVVISTLYYSTTAIRSATEP